MFTSGPKASARQASTPKRFDPQRRREHLLSVGAGLFATAAYDEVWIEQVASEAGVSRGLLYHYFKNKREFFAAIVEAECAKLAAQTAPDLALPLVERLNSALEGYFDYVEQNPDGYRTLHRATLSADTKARAIVGSLLDLQARRILGSITRKDPAPEPLVSAVHGWLALLISVTTRWIEHPELTRVELRELCVRTLLAAIEWE